MNILSPTISRLVRMRLWTMEQWLHQPLDAQHDMLLHIINQGEYTEFGKKYQFEHINTPEDYAKCVPLFNYEQYAPYIERMMQGEENILWNTPIKWYAKSSGTTAAKSKFIPVSEESMKENHFLASKDVLSFYYLKNPESTLLAGRGLIIGGSHKINELNENTSVGDLSAIVMQNSPFWVDWVRTPDLDILLMDDWEKKLEKLVETTIIENVTSISGVPTWTLTLLRKILEHTQKKSIAEVWPNLELYMHGGVSFIPYKKEFENIIGKPIKYLEMYNASEGFFAAQTDDEVDGLLLMVNHGIYYEFIDMATFHTNEQVIVNLAQVELQKNYAMVITTYSGLYRYTIGDTVMFTSIEPYRIKVTGRTKHYINAFGEELIVDNADEAIAKACAKTNASVIDYTAAPVYFEGGNKARHEWVIEFSDLPSNIDNFAALLDECLKACNSDYEAKRCKDLALLAPIIHVAPKQLFQQWLESKGKSGGQHKVPRLNNDRIIIDEVKKIGNL